jgi:hypothetical protein
MGAGQQTLRRGGGGSLSSGPPSSGPASLDLEDARPLLSGKPPARSGAVPTKLQLPSLQLALCWGAMFAVYLLAYHTSLMGGSHSRDLAFINAHLNTIGRSIVVSLLAFTVCLWLTPLLGGAAWAARGLLLAANLLWLAWDHGNDFHTHGVYNWALLLIIGLPLNLVLLGLFCWYQAAGSPKRFATSFVGSSAAAALVVTLLLLHFQRLEFVGFFGRSLVQGCSGKHCPKGSEPNCVVPRTIPWIDLLPKGAQNFWTGRQTCTPVRGFEASFSDDGLLTISGCRPDERIEYTPLPSTRGWDEEAKTHEQAAYQTSVLRAMKAESYTKPVQLNATEAVLARCGDAERLLLRIERLTARPSPEPPLAKREAEPRAAAAAGRPPRLNVLVLFIDSLGRRHFFRRMPKAAAALEAVARSRRASLYQFFRYHVVGFHTDPNSHVMYTGTPFNERQPPYSPPFWEAYRQAGYVSGSVYNLCEDWGTEYRGKVAPHDHELVAPFCLPEYHPWAPDGEPYQIFKGAFSILRRCLRGQFVHRYNFDYTRKFMAAYDSFNPWLLMSSFHEAHEGTGEVIATVDADLAAFYRGLTQEQLDRTAIITVADHGMTMGLNYMYMREGRVAHKFPLLAMLLPRWLEEAHPAAVAALRANEQRLVSAYDLHTTLHHLLHLGESAQPTAQQYTSWVAAGNISESVRWGVSLLDEVPAGRSCDDAGVPPEFCQCFLP